MKLWIKLALVISLIIVILFSIGGYLIIHKSLDFAIDQIIRQYMFQHSNYRILIEKEAYEDDLNIDDKLKKLYETVEFIGNINHIALYTFENDKLFSLYNAEIGIDFIGELVELKDGYLTKEVSNEFILGAISTFVIDEQEYYFITVNRSIDIFLQRTTLQRQILLIGIVFLICILICVWIFSKYITLPIQKLTNVSEKIANGSYDDRTHIISNDEVGILARNFDKMADTIEEKINSLNQSIQSRDDFVSNFSHELKTPMTSIIGYADMLRSYENSPEVQIKSANLIYKESKRISELSLKLMDLMGLSDEHVAIEPIDAEKLKHDTGKHFIWNMQPSTVYADKILINSMLKNLCDNAEKAGANRIIIKGYIEEDKYRIAISDNGRGISQEDISRIKEPFYRTDKDRAGTHVGYGLGLSLCEKISNLHGSSLIFESVIGYGTTVSFELFLYQLEK